MTKMLRRLFGLCSIFALSAKALVLPPGFEPATDHDALGLFVDQKRIIKNEDSDKDVSIQDGPNDVALSFSISSDGERLELNGQPIYPPQFHSDAYLHGSAIYVDQVPASAAEIDVATNEAKSTPLKITSSVLRIESDHPVSKNGDAIIPVKFQIMTLEEQPIGLDEVAVDLLKTGTGEYYIVKVDTMPSPNFVPSPPLTSPSNVIGGLKECASLPQPICKLKNMVESKITSLRNHKSSHSRPCPGSHRRLGHRPTHLGPHFGSAASEGRLRGHHGRPHNMKPSSRHYHHHRYHGHHFLCAFARGIIAVVIPILAGITVGLSVSFLGLLVARMIGYVWIKFAGGGRKGYTSVALEESSQDEGRIMLYEDELEAPPVYEEAPSYEESEEQQQ